MILKPVYEIFKGRSLYLNPSIIKVLKQLDNDIIILGGLQIPTVLIANLYCRLLKKERCIYSERFSKYSFSKIQKFFLRLLYGNPKYIFAIGKNAVKQFKELFPKSRVYNMPYPADIESNLRHKVRENVSSVRFLFSGQFRVWSFV